MKHNINANISPIISNNVNYHVKFNEAVFCLLFIEENKVLDKYSYGLFPEIQYQNSRKIP